MSESKPLAIFDEIESLVSDQLQVVSYKWLSRNFLVSSNTAKRLLKEFVEKRGNSLEVIYTLSGWLKSKPSDYHIRLVSSSKLSEAEKDFNGKCSVQVYSVQASVPTDPAALWNVEFVQAEGLFKQPSEVDNCLRDNRFCGISNSLVKRSVEGTAVDVSTLQTKSVASTLQPKTSLSGQEAALTLDQHKKFQQPSPRVGIQSHPVQDQSLKPSSDREKVHVPVNKEGRDQKSSSGTGSSLSNLWGRASLKSKNDSASTDDKNGISDHTVVPENQILSRDTEAQIPSLDPADERDSDDETRDATFKRTSKPDNRKRKVIFDLSDEEYEDAVSLASPDVPKAKSCLHGKQTPNDSSPVRPDALESGKMEVDEPKVKEEAGSHTSLNSKNVSLNTLPLEEIQTIDSDVRANLKDEETEISSSPKRKKVLKTRIDERGREVTEVVWEVEKTERKKGNTDAEKKEETNAAKKINDTKNTESKPIVTKKTPTVGNPGGKSGNKKGGNAKDPKQGNIMSFFKRV